MNFFGKLCFVIALDGVLLFHQTDYRLVHERVALDYYNESYLRDFQYKIFFCTRKEKKLNLSIHILQDILGNNIKNIAKAYKFSSNEYRDFPVYYSGNGCDSLKYDTFGTGLSHYDTNFTLCPVRKGFYYVANAYLNESRLPPYAPRGRYMLEFKMVYNGTILLGSGKWYGAIVPTNPLEKSAL